MKRILRLVRLRVLPPRLADLARRPRRERVQRDVRAVLAGPGGRTAVRGLEQVIQSLVFVSFVLFFLVLRFRENGGFVVRRLEVAQRGGAGAFQRVLLRVQVAFGVRRNGVRRRFGRGFFPRGGARSALARVLGAGLRERQSGLQELRVALEVALEVSRGNCARF